MKPEDFNTNKEKLLWDRFRNGDDIAYSLIYKEHIHILFAYGMRFTTDRELVRDCVQDVFVKIYSNRSRLNSTDNIKLYLFMALKNTLFNVFEKDRKDFTSDGTEPVFTADFSIEDRWIMDEENQELRRKLIRIIELLTPRQKEVLYYRYMAGMELKDVGLLMEMNVQSVKNLLQRSIKQVKKLLEENNSGKMSIWLKKRC